MPTELKPNLFIVGAQKSGTSALAGWLGQHPQVCMAFPKEPGYLAFGDAGYPFRDGFGKPAPASTYVVKSARNYSRLFAAATPEQTVIGEASTWYFALPETAAKIQSYNSAAKVIVILRDPVERAYSAWCHARSDELEPCDSFAAALAMERRRGEVEFLLRYRKMGLYSEALAAYQAHFPPEQLLVLFYQDLRADPAALWREVCHFLGVDSTPEPDYAQRYNRAGSARVRILHKLLRSHRLKHVVRGLLPHATVLRIRQQVDDFNLQSFPTLDAPSRDKLRAYFRSDIEQLSRLTGRDLKTWLQ